jgi:hypothetical protein
MPTNNMLHVREQVLQIVSAATSKRRLSLASERGGQPASQPWSLQAGLAGSGTMGGGTPILQNTVLNPIY